MPREWKILNGNPGKRDVEAQAEAPKGWPELPAYLSRVAQEEWRRLANLMDAELRLSPSDGPILAGAAVAFDKALQFEQKAKRRGLPDDEWRKFSTGSRIQWDTYRKFVNDLCLSPGTRGRAKVGGRGTTTTKLSAFLGGAKAK